MTTPELTIDRILETSKKSQIISIPLKELSKLDVQELEVTVGEMIDVIKPEVSSITTELVEFPNKYKNFADECTFKGIVVPVEEGNEEVFYLIMSDDLDEDVRDHISYLLCRKINAEIS